MPRPKWTPETATDEQRRLLDAAASAFREAGQWERAGYAAIRAAQAAGVPIENIAAYIKATTGARISPATIYRHISDPSPDPDGQPAIIADLPAETRAAVDRELRRAGWTLREFILGSLTMLARDPGPYLARLAEVYERRRDRRRRRSG